MESRYPKPDRSNVYPNFVKSEENDALDLGGQEGALKDGRPFRVEFWCQDQISVLTFFFSTIGLENKSQEDMERLLTSENLIQFKPGKRYVEAKTFVDPSGNEMWSVNVVIGDEDSVFAEGGPALKPSARS